MKLADVAPCRRSRTSRRPCRSAARRRRRRPGLVRRDLRAERREPARVDLLDGVEAEGVVAVGLDELRARR